MNFKSYKLWRDKIVRERSPLRLDCMNPIVALDYLRPKETVSQPIGPVDLIQTWAGIADFPLGEQFVVGRGIRAFLRVLFGKRLREWDKVWLPEDVYPTYWELAKGHNCLGFRSWPQLDLSRVLESRTSDCLLLPSPLTPTGRYLAAAEADSLITWLEQEKRMIVLDSVYQFTGPIPAGVGRLMSHPRCIVLRSVSKSWISRQVLGVVDWSESDREMFSLIVEVAMPDEFSSLHGLMKARPKMTSSMAEDFSAEWNRLAPLLRTVDPSWGPPDTGYFSVVRGAARVVLDEYNILAVPGSVFGSDETEWSVISCLHDLHKRGRNRVD